MKPQTSFIVFFIGLLFISCKGNYSFIEKYPNKNIPLIDSTNFANHHPNKKLSKRKIKKLHLEKVLGEEQLKDSQFNIGISYLPLLSSNFKTIVYYFYTSNTVLQSILVNYDHHFNLIDYQIIAFDEISDNFLKSTSIINTNSIHLKEYNFYISNKPTELHYLINEQGKISLK